MKTIATYLSLALFAATAAAAPFKLTSKDFKEGGAISDKQVFNSFGCTGGNVSPELEWSNPPKDTKSFALMVYDPDAPTGSGWWHWVVYNIPASATSIPGGGPVPTGAVQGNTDFGVPGWGGPCPPAGSGNHHYQFTLFALKVDKLDLPANATAAFVGFNVMANSIGKAKLTGIYNRKK
ncbi:MAG TPA: YbhB/YbcL family Raf kinase inhibitor-like protein [Kofleriaceae bacterium]|nr:YbhB/YbcL family Raf kinase inhibitor-like protein [Kofleriaceae bacterium]